MRVMRSLPDQPVVLRVTQREVGQVKWTLEAGAEDRYHVRWVFGGGEEGLELEDEADARVVD